MTETQNINSRLPDGAHLAYNVFHEAWYASQPGVVDGRSIGIAASHGPNDGVAWEFTIEEVSLAHDTAIRVAIFDAAFAAFAHIPEFFAGLAGENPYRVQTLHDVRRLLDRLGAVDETKRAR